MYLIISKSTQSEAVMKAVKPDANVQMVTLLFTFTVHTYIYPPVSNMHAMAFHVSGIH